MQKTKFSRYVCVTFVCAGALATPIVAHAQSRIEGTILWADNTPAAGVVVSVQAVKHNAVTDAAGRTTFTTSDIETNEFGRYGFGDLKLGFWATLTIAARGSVLVRRDVLIEQRLQRLDITLPATSTPPPPTASQPPTQAPRDDPRGQPTQAAATAVYEETPALSFRTEVTVTAELPMLSPTAEAGRVVLSPDQVAALPSLGTRDVFRALQLLPGVSSNETSSGLFVRGGTPDQNLVDYDGFTVYSVDHLFGYFSAFNMDAIETIELSKGGYEARHGGRLSSLTEIRGRGQPKRLGGSVGGSLLSAEGVVEIPLTTKGSFLFGTRQSFQSPLYDRILGLVNTRPRQPGPGGGGPFAAQFSSQPTSGFADFNGRLEARPSTRDELIFSAFQGNDDVDNSRELSLPTQFIDRLTSLGLDVPGTLTFRDVRTFRNHGASGRWSHQWHPRVKTVATFAQSRYTATTAREANIAGRDGSTGETNAVDDSTVRLDVPIQVTPLQQVMFGFQRTSNRVRYGLQDFQRPGVGSGTAPQLGNLSSRLDRDTSGDLTTWYAQGRFLAGGRLIADPGLRITTFSLTGGRYIEPRLSATLLSGEKLRFKAAWGRYHQFVSRLTREDVLQGNREFWSLADGVTVPVATSTNFAAGATFDSGRMMIDAEVFARKLTDLSQLAARVTGASEGLDLSQFFYRGEGRIYGLESLFQRRWGPHTGLASYTFSRVTYEFPELGTFPADHDRTHELKLLDTLRFQRWTLSATWILSSGRPYTAPIGTETVTLSVPDPLGDDTAEDGEQTNVIGFERIVVGDKNASRLPAYHRLDLAANYIWPFGRSGRTATLAISLFNAYNRHNIWYKEFSSVGGELVENNVNLMGLTLNTSLTVKF